MKKYLLLILIPFLIAADYGDSFSNKASKIKVADIGGYYASPVTVESALQQIGSGSTESDPLSLHLDQTTPQTITANVIAGGVNNIQFGNADGVYGMTIQNTSDVVGSFLQLRNDWNSPYHAIEWGITGSASSAYGINGEMGYMGMVGAYPFAFITNNEPRLTVDDSGNVGIGTTTPTSKLTLKVGDFIPTITFWGVGLNDLSFNQTAQKNSSGYISISSVGATDTFSGYYSDSYFDSVPITGSPQLIDPVSGTTITFTSITGHTLYDYWIVGVGQSQAFNVKDVLGNDLMTLSSVGDFVMTGSINSNTVTTTSYLTFIGSGLYDITWYDTGYTNSGRFVESTVTYTLTIDSVGAIDTFSWSSTNGDSGSLVPIDVINWNLLSQGIYVEFANETGHTLNDTFTSVFYVPNSISANYGSTGRVFLSPTRLMINNLSDDVPELRIFSPAWKTSDIVDIQNGLPILNIKPSGYVGIGNALPTERLDVVGNETITGNIYLSGEGGGFYIKEGSNATMGVATLVAGTVTVSTTKVTANSRIFLTPQTLGTILRPVGIGITARTAGTSFVITSTDITDTSTVGWLIMEPTI